MSKLVKQWLDVSYDQGIPYIGPIRLDASVTTVCNSKCLYCWQQDKSPGILSFDLLAGVLDSMSCLQVPHILLTGGEPTLWPDFERFIVYTKQRRIKNVLLCTNGRRFKDKRFLSFVIANGVRSINISVDTLDPELFERLRGYPFSEFKKVLSHCLWARLRWPGLRIGLVSVMSKLATPEMIFQVQKFCQRNFLSHFLQTFDPVSVPEINAQCALTDEEKRSYHQRLSWLRGSLARAVRREVNPLMGKDTYCYKGYTTVKIFSNGDVHFCWNSPVIGNIAKESFEKIWTSERAREIRQYIHDRKCKCGFDCDIFESLKLYGDA